MAKHWMGTVEDCNVCGDVLTKDMYDARIPHVGSWANICYACFREYGCKLGTGHGQHYRRELATGRWEKVEG
jgi:hypothetical protein